MGSFLLYIKTKSFSTPLFLFTPFPSTLSFPIIRPNQKISMEKVVYKAPNIPGTHMPDVFIMTEPGMAAKYRAQRSHQGPSGNHQRHFKESDMHEPPIALVDVVQSFEIYQTVTGKGFEGKVARPAKSDLASLFNTENHESIAEQIIMQGEIQAPHHGK